MAIYPLLQPRKLWTLSHIILQGSSTIGLHDLRLLGTSEWGQKSGAQALSLFLPTCAAEKNVRILAALFMQLRSLGEGVEGVLS